MKYIQFIFGLILVFGPAILGSVCVHRAIRSPKPHIRTVGASVAALFVLVVAAFHYRSGRVYSELESIQKGMNIRDVSLEPDADELAASTPAQRQTVRLVSWSTTMGDYVRTAEVDPRTGAILSLSGLFLCGGPVPLAVMALTYAAAAVGFALVCHGIAWALRHGLAR